METFEEYTENDIKCVASKCTSVRWSKPRVVRKLLFASKDVLLIHIGKTLVFHNVRTKEDVLVVVGDDSTPSEVSLPLDSVGFVSCGPDNILALAEHPPLAKVVICKYPDLEVSATLVDSSSSTPYKSINLLGFEYLIGLRDYPEFDLIMWAWRVQEKLIVVNTGFIQPNQSLHTLLSTGREIYLSQTERDVKCKLQLWTLFFSCKTVYAKNMLVGLQDDSNVGSGCWTSSGWFIFCDLTRNAVYRTQPGAPNPEMCIEYTVNNFEQTPALVCSIGHHKQGFVLYTYNELRGVLLELTKKKENLLKVYGISIKYFTFIKPTDETVATVNENNILQLWDVSTGEFKSEVNLSGIATHISSYPFDSYFAISFKNGKVEIFKTLKNNELKRIAKIVLCDEEISSVHFLLGPKCIAASFSIGRFYYIDIVLGQKCSVIREHNLKKHVIDIEIIEDNKSSILIVLYKNEQTEEIAGNNFILFDTNFNAIFKLKNSEFYYSSISKWYSSGEPDVINIAFTVLLSKCIHLMQINIVQAKILKLKDIPLNHLLRQVEVSVGKNHFVTFSYDGTFNLYEFEDNVKWKQIISVNCSRWQTGGLKVVQVDINGRNILTLSVRGNFMCTGFNETCDHNRQSYVIDKPIFLDVIRDTEGIGFEDDSETQNRVTWTMINEKNELDADNVLYSQQKNEIIRAFNNIKKEVLLILLNTNVNGSEDTRINIEEFDLNVDYRQEFREKSKIKRQIYEEKILDDINKFKIETENIIKEHWEYLSVKPMAVYCLKKLYKVDNYPISIQDQGDNTLVNQIIEKRKLIEDEENPSTSSIYPSASTDWMDDETVLTESDYKQNKHYLMGSISYKLMNSNIENLNFQNNYYQLEKAEDEIILLKFVINRLKENFNEIFNDLFVKKQVQLNNLKEHNNSLREIENEFRLACKVESTELSVVDFEWNQYEQTEQLIHTKDDEVSLKSHNVLSNKQTMLGENSAKDEHNAQSLAIDNFRREALITMMDGVLEKRWEDELKKDVPISENILNKKPENYTEEDFKDLDEYDNLVAAKNNERLKYKKILEEKKATIIQQINKSIEEFDNDVFEIYKIKLKYNSAINQENLKINRISKMLSDISYRKQQIKLHEFSTSKNILHSHLFPKSISEIEQTIAETNKNITNTETIHGGLINSIELFKEKDNDLQTNFKSVFPSKLIYKQALDVYNRRPKLQGDRNYSLLLGYQFISNIMGPGHDESNMNLEFVKYLDTLKVYDDFKYVEDNELNMDKITWNKVCNLRRIKIESEFKIRTFERDATEKANLLDNLIHDKEDDEILIQKLKSSIITLKNKDKHYENDSQIQLVLKQGNVQVQTTGHISDFYKTKLLPKSDIEEVNAKIKEMGKIKIDLLSKFLKYKSKYQLLEPELENLKDNKIKLYKYRYNYITSMKMTENILHYLKFKQKGINIAKQAEQNADKGLAGIQIHYAKEKVQLNQCIDELSNKIKKIKQENEKIEKNIDLTNLKLSELKNSIDISLTNKLKLITDTRLKNVMRRTKIMSKIMNLYKEVYVLETELELLLLKRYPTLF
ncbi:WD40/YVTN repeat-like-containing domain,WD40-repeat-containing domain [Cinara cedri]|uniref:Cilia- and flagella-associated protein 43 n=1 Tax=Cinara cedri TaxID=506608 RepID=A0A5E4NLW1_9HEMI|nr:WD40/YVTN repeat-like-containing domain,WD40-repeat-containing domain [Cinara cedri]